jgi:hypothetical protein
LPDLIRQSIFFKNASYKDRWMRGSSPRMTLSHSPDAAQRAAFAA